MNALWLRVRWRVAVGAGALLVFCALVTHEERWADLGVDHIKPYYFLDTVTLLSAGQAWHAGRDPYLPPNPFDPLGRPHSYGPWWLVSGPLGLTTADAAWLGPLLGLVLLFYATGIVFVLTVLGTIARICGFRITDLLRYFKEELLLILGTASSEPAMPALMRKLEKLGVSRDTVSVVVPTGYSFNLDGTAIAMSLTLLFVGQALGIDLTFLQKVQLLLLCMLTSKGAAGVAGSGMVVMVSTLHTAGTIPVAGLTLVVGIDRFMSECRALVNFIGNAVATIAVAKYEKRLNANMLRGELSGHAAPEDGWG